MSNYIATANNNLSVLDGNTFVKCLGIIRNENVSNWLKIVLCNRQKLIVTSDHPFITEYGKTIASDLIVGEPLFYKNKPVKIHSIEPIKKTDYSYDVETSSGMFSISNVKSSNCRTSNGFDINGLGQQKDGRGNICPVTVILPTLAAEVVYDKKSKNPVEDFMKLLDKKIGEAKDMLIERFNWICSQSPESAPFMYENGTMAGYDGKNISSALKHGTLALGQLGLAECLQILIGKDHTTPEGMELAKRIEGLFKQRCAEYKEQYKLNFGVYMTPAENLCFTAMTKFRKKYGVIPGVSDRKYFTNSMHVPVWKEMTPFKKIDIESQLTGYSSAGCITYVELPSSVINNIDGLETLVKYAMDKDIPYFAVNVPNDMCMDCGWQGDIKSDTCPKCGSGNIQRLRRVTGYLSTDYHNFNEGKIAEVEDRVKHIDDYVCGTRE